MIKVDFFDKIHDCCCINSLKTDGLIMTWVNCTRFLAILASSWLLSVCQLQCLSVSVSVGRTEHVLDSFSVGRWTVAHWPVYSSLYSSLSLAWKVEIILPVAPPGRLRRQWFVTKERGERQSRRSFIHSFNWRLAAVMKREGRRGGVGVVSRFTHWLAGSTPTAALFGQHPWQVVHN